jgi:homopolymeric O-antigen transport system ATP-binding protein
MQPIIQLNKVSKQYALGNGSHRSLKELALSLGRKPRVTGQIDALREVDMALYPGEILGLIGFNGSGKSTLLKIVAGITKPTSGEAITSGRISSLLELGVGFHPEMTGRENVYINGSFLGMPDRDITAHMDEIIEFSELARFIDMPVKHYSSGMFLRLGFAVGICLDPDVLLIDEGFAVGDEAFQIKCIKRIRTMIESGKSMILVSHALSMIVELCTRALLIKDGAIAAEGSPSDVVFKYHKLVEEKISIKQVKRLDIGDLFTVDRTGNGHVEVLSANLLDNEGNERHEFDATEGWTLDIKLHANRPIDAPKIVVAITDIKRNPLFATNNESEGKSYAKMEGDFNCRFHLDRFNLMAGYYLISVMAMPYHHDDQGDDAGAGWLEDVFDIRNGLLGFHIKPTPDANSAHWGAAYQDHHWEF